MKIRNNFTDCICHFRIVLKIPEVEYTWEQHMGGSRRNTIQKQFVPSDFLDREHIEAEAIVTRRWAVLLYRVPALDLCHLFNDLD